MASKLGRATKSAHLYLVGADNPANSKNDEISSYVGISHPNEIKESTTTHHEIKQTPEHLKAIMNIELVRTGLMSRTELKALYPDTYSNWQNMKQRSKRETVNELHPSFKDFADFLEIVGPRPEPSSSLDRIDHTGPYSPENVRWADKKTQSRNRSNTIFLTLEGVTKPLTVWAEAKGINPDVYRGRKRAGWTDEETIRGSKSSASFNKSSHKNLDNCWTYTPWPVAHRERLEVLYQGQRFPHDNRLSFMKTFSLRQMHAFVDEIDSLYWPDDFTPTDAQRMELKKYTDSYDMWSSIYRHIRILIQTPHRSRRFIKVPSNVEKALGEHVNRLG